MWGRPHGWLVGCAVAGSDCGCEIAVLQTTDASARSTAATSMVSVSLCTSDLTDAGASCAAVAASEGAACPEAAASDGVACSAATRTEASARVTGSEARASVNLHAHDTPSSVASVAWPVT